MNTAETATQEVKRILSKRDPAITVPQGKRAPVSGLDAHKVAYKLLKEMKG